MLVVIAGMPRSGSTFTFNIARELLKRRGNVYQEAQGKADVIKGIEQASAYDHVLLKAHDAEPLTVAMMQQGMVRTICTVRSLEDAAASWLETFELSEAQTIELMRNWLRMFAQIRSQALVISYEQIDRHPITTAWRIGRYLYPGASPLGAIKAARRHSKKNTKQLVDALQPEEVGVQDMGFTYYAKDTFYHRRHVTSLRSRPASTRIPADQIARIKNALAHEVYHAGLLDAEERRRKALREQIHYD